MEIKDATTLVLENIGNLLLEGRVEDVKKKYPYYESDNIDKLTSFITFIFLVLPGLFNVIDKSLLSSGIFILVFSLSFR